MENKGTTRIFKTSVHGNTARIERVTHKPYKDAPAPVTGYRLCISADYNHGFVYHVSVHETMEEATAKMERCGTGWAEMSR